MNKKLFQSVRHGSALVMVGAIGFFLWVYVFPRLAGSEKAKVPQIVANLKQIALAKHLWSDDNNITGAVQVTEAELAFFFRTRSNAFVNPVAGELYSINPMGTPPQAELTCDLGRGFPKGAVIRLGTGDSGYEVIPAAANVGR